MNPASDLETVEIAKYEATKHESGVETLARDSSSQTKNASSTNPISVFGPEPTKEELATLVRVSGKIPWTAYTITFVELCERFSYYGTTAVFVNYIQRPLPEGSTTGANGDGQPGALGLGQRASTGLTTFNAFWAYLMPLLGAYMADQYWGRFKTIQVSIGIALLGHIILIVSAIPSVITNPNGAIAAFAVGIVIMGFGVGGFKSNISPLIAEQIPETTLYVKTNRKGVRVIVDPAITYARVFLYFYMMINIGSLTGQIGMVYAEKYVGFWLSYLLPTIMLALCPLVVILCKKYYVLTVPTGSVFPKFFKVLGFALKGRAPWSPNWNNAKPSMVAERPATMTWDDHWVDEVRRGLLACRVFLWYPLYWLAYGQMTNNLTSQAATMQLNNVPNDLITNLNPISIVILIPIMDYLVYPAIRKTGFHLTPLKKITIGFFLASMAMVAACVIQYYIYQTSPCGNNPNACDEDNFAPINVWVQTVPYVLIGLSEILASITSLEYAFTKAPKNMRSMVQAVCLSMNAFSSAISQALVALAEDPLLVINYGLVAGLAFLGGVGFWLSNYKLDRQEDELNQLKAGNTVSESHGDVAISIPIKA